MLGRQRRQFLVVAALLLLATGALLGLLSPGFLGGGDEAVRGTPSLQHMRLQSSSRTAPAPEQPCRNTPALTQAPARPPEPVRAQYALRAPVQDAASEVGRSWENSEHPEPSSVEPAPAVAEIPASEPFRHSHWRTEHTVDAQLLFESRRLRVEVHSVKFDSGLEVPDWLWIDTPDIVNVVPRTPEGNYWVIRERRYGLRKRCLGTVGGHMNPGEDPLVSAKRELLEEMQMTASRWRLLGSYRTDANRGAGVGYFYLAEDAEFVDPSQKAPMEEAGRLAALEPNNPPHKNYAGEIPPEQLAEGHHSAEEEDPYGSDIESMQPVLLDQTQFMTRLLDNSFQEVKWSGAAALALLRVLADQLLPRQVPEIPRNDQGPDSAQW